jgi:hypothetical protein
MDARAMMVEHLLDTQWARIEIKIVAANFRQLRTQARRA